MFDVIDYYTHLKVWYISFSERLNEYKWEKNQKKISTEWAQISEQEQFPSSIGSSKFKLILL